MALTGPLLVLLGAGALTLATENNCSQCVVTTRRGRVSSQTLVYHTIYDCKGQRIGNCIYNETQYALCREGNRTVCYDPKELPYQYWVEIKTNSEEGRLIGKSKVITNLSHPVWVAFDACDAIDDDPYTNCGNMGWRTYYSQSEKYVCLRPKSSPPPNCYISGADSIARGYHYCGGIGWSCACWSTTTSWGWPRQCKGTQLEAEIKRGNVFPNCTSRSCNPVNLTIWNPGQWKQQDVEIGLLIYGPGEDPGVVLKIIIEEKSRESIQHNLLFNSFYHEIETGVKYEIPTVAKNLFVNLAENIAKSLNVTNCYVCGGTDQGERWPWEALESNISDPQVWKTMEKGNREQQWVLQTSIIGRSCWQNLKEDGTQMVSQLETQISKLTEAVENQTRLYLEALERNRKAEKSETFHDHLKHLEEELLSYLKFLEQLNEKMKLDSRAAEVGFDMNVDAILARVEQLVKLEGDAVIENKTMAYSLRRKLKTQRNLKAKSCT